jgi:hypothetical protein
MLQQFLKLYHTVGLKYPLHHPGVGINWMEDRDAWSTQVL